MWRLASWYAAKILSNRFSFLSFVRALRLPPLPPAAGLPAQRECAKGKKASKGGLGQGLWIEASNCSCWTLTSQVKRKGKGNGASISTAAELS